MPFDDEPWPAGESRTVLNKPGWDLYIAKNDIHSEKALAAVLRISEPALWRVRQGHSQPGTKFIRHAIRALNAPYDELFTHLDAA